MKDVEYNHVEEADVLKSQILKKKMYCVYLCNTNTSIGGV